MEGEKRFRVYNKCKYDIGVTLMSGQAPNIRAGGFQLLTVNDILYIESLCTRDKFFSTKRLVIMDDNEKELTLDQIGGYPDETVEKHLNDEEIIAALKKPNKAFEAWLEKVNDPEELHAIYDVAQGLDLPSSKLKMLKAKVPNKDWLGEE